MEPTRRFLLWRGKQNRQENTAFITASFAEIICRDHPSVGQSWLSTNMEIAARCIPYENYVNPIGRRPQK